MDTKEYITKQLGRTNKKHLEAYVVTRIIHLLNDLSIKFVTQQYVARPDGKIALTDLFFPQLGLHIEVDEDHHSSVENTLKDNAREADIINMTDHEVVRVDCTNSQSLESMNLQIDEIVAKIKSLKESKLKLDEFTPWNLETEYNSQTYIDLGYMDVKDDIAFKTIKDACNCFGHNYKGYQKASAHHPDPEIMIWFPKLYTNDDWQNEITMDEETITTKSTSTERNKEDYLGYMSNVKTGKHKHKRVVFARVKGNLGDILYRFRGLYELDTNASTEENGLVLKRTDTKVETFQPKIS